MNYLQAARNLSEAIRYLEDTIADYERISSQLYALTQDQPENALTPEDWVRIIAFKNAMKESESR